MEQMKRKYPTEEKRYYFPFSSLCCHDLLTILHTCMKFVNYKNKRTQTPVTFQQSSSLFNYKLPTCLNSRPAKNLVRKDIT